MRTLQERFWSKVDMSGGPDACWPWTKGLKSSGYGQFRVAMGESPRVASRVAWALTFGDAGMFSVLHRCDNPPCCNPAHLFLGTQQDNMDDMLAKGRGGQIGCPDVAAFVERVRRLSDDDIREARRARANGETFRSIGKRFGVAHSTIVRLVNGQHWKSLPR